MIARTRFVYVPPGGYGLPDGRVLSASDVVLAVARYARRHNCYSRTVRVVTVMFREAMREYADARPTATAAA